MSDSELLEVCRTYDAAKIALAQAEEDLHVAMAARLARRELRAASQPICLLSTPQETSAL